MYSAMAKSIAIYVVMPSSYSPECVVVVGAGCGGLCLPLPVWSVPLKGGGCRFLFDLLADFNEESMVNIWQLQA